MATIKCPACDWEMKGPGITVKVGRKTLTVCCEECAEKVKQSPKR